jgi:hypothetical protein
VNVGKASISEVESEQEVGKGCGKWKLERKQVLEGLKKSGGS